MGNTDDDYESEYESEEETVNEKMTKKKKMPPKTRGQGKRVKKGIFEIIPKQLFHTIKFR